MLLKTLEIQGFKTFPDKTALTFDQGITAVVGPNGSGKSNISDAMRWVLGEQSTRTLRCTKMEDVIFNGTPTRKAQGFAEVTLTIDNTGRQLNFDNDTVAVTRRYYRSGESEYLINKAAVRLRDINELFMDTGLGRDGYSIIGQGKIDSIVAARSEDRRETFEEAAGISRFRYRKAESERRLAQAEENLLRLRDILAELEARVGPLKEQAEKAEQYLKYAEEKRGLEIGLWLNTLNRSGQILREHEDRILLVRGQHEEVEKELETIADRIEANFTKANECAIRADQARTQAAGMEETASAQENEASILANDVLHNNENIARMAREIEQAALTGRAIDETIAAKECEIEAKRVFIRQKDEETLRGENRLEEIRQGMGKTAARIEACTELIRTLNARAAEERLASVTAESAMQEINRRLEAIQEDLNARRDRLKKQGAAELELREMTAQAGERVEALQNSVKGYELRLSSRKKRAEEKKELSDSLRLDLEENRRRVRLLEDLERNLEGFSQSVKTVMREAGRGTLSGIHGPVSRLIQVPRDYAVALETALGAAMQNIVVGTEQDAKRAIGLLKQRDSGRATFLPLSTIHGNVLNESGLSEHSGFIGVASTLCRCEAEYKGVLDSLLGRIAVAEDLDAAVAIARKYHYRFRVVTLDGQVVNTGGSLTGGSQARNSGLLSRASEIERLKARVEALSAQAEEAAAQCKSTQEEASAAEASLTGARGELSAAQEDWIRFQTELKRAAVELSSLKADLAALELEDAQSRERMRAQEKAKEEADERARDTAVEISELQGKLNEIHGSRGEQDAESQTISANLQELRFARLSAEKDTEALRAGIAELERRRADREGHVRELEQQILKVKQNNAELGAKIESLQQRAFELRKSAQERGAIIKQINTQRLELEKQATTLRMEERERSGEKERIGHELARLEERKSGLQKEYDEIISRLWEEYELTRREAEESISPVGDAGLAQRRLNELKGKIKALGTVNVAAVEEYKEVGARYTFMKEQVEDVEKSRAELIRLIGDLTGQMRELFLSRFQQINDNFRQTFRELFGGGTADLSLSDPEDILRSGIEIAVQPPGKIVTHLESLSGGEKALVAIALYFAIMKVNPPPFCMLDEIEAALDDVNVDRFASYLRKMNDNTQFIAISHRRGTMEEADVLYGVTMQDEGVSKVLALRASEVEQKLGMK